MNHYKYYLFWDFVLKNYDFTCQNDQNFPFFIWNLITVWEETFARKNICDFLGDRGTGNIFSAKISFFQWDTLPTARSDTISHYESLDHDRVSFQPLMFLLI